MPPSEIPIPNGATDLYIQAFTDPTGRDTFQAVTPAEFAALSQKSQLADAV